MENELKFEVGSMYKNMKGNYKVISLHKESMVIRWDNGTEVDTSIVMQKNIIERMAQEKEFQRQKDQKDTDKNKKKRIASFDGFKEGDFKNSSKNATWRSRNNIGGAVTKELHSEKNEFGSWAVLMRPEVQWMDVKRHDKKSPDYGIGFFSRLTHNGLYYGISVKLSTTDKRTETESWDHFNDWMTRNENENWLKKVAADHDLIIYDASRKGFTQDIKVHEEKWELKEDNTPTTIDSLSTFFAALFDAKRIDLRIEKMMEKEEALSRGKNIVSEITTLFNCLMPLYKVAPVHTK